MRFFACALIVGALVTLPAAAHAVWDDQNGYTQIKSGDYVAAERLLLAQRARFPADPDLMINLAAIYAQTGRVAEARVLYQSVIAMPDEVLLVGRDEAASAHHLASRGLTKLLPRVVAAR